MKQAILLDTHIWIWMVAGKNERVARRAHEELDAAAERNGIGVSEISFWEIALKSAKGTLEVQPNARDWLKRASRMPGLGIIQIDRDVMVRSTELDIPVRDPADRVLIATSLRYDLTLATSDRQILDYATENKAFSVLDCRAAAPLI